VIWVCFISSFGELGFNQFSVILRNLATLLGLGFVQIW
jgi:hypothetical protein